MAKRCLRKMTSTTTSWLPEGQVGEMQISGPRSKVSAVRPSPIPDPTAPAFSLPFRAGRSAAFHSGKQLPQTVPHLPVAPPSPSPPHSESRNTNVIVIILVKCLLRTLVHLHSSLYGGGKRGKGRRQSASE
uniref:Uncharacterized protein n=1 Tax=Pipistrellus kuhlii TaxID=59472 RepID=A0A7J8A8S5_PIPKU|nr:hypothetical protein mPipKuh1_009011 [Pipistrellus kuhlii]